MRDQAELKRVKLTIEMIVSLLNDDSRRTVRDIALMTGNSEWTVRYLLRKHNCHRVVRWECPPTEQPAEQSAPSERGA